MLSYNKTSPTEQKGNKRNGILISVVTPTRKNTLSYSQTALLQERKKLKPCN